MELVTYLDESGIHSESTVLTVAGYLSHAELWVEFEQQWRQCLSRLGLSSFHMTDYENRKNGFENLGNDRIKLLKKLIHIIHKNLAYGVSVSVKTDDFAEFLPVKNPRDILVGAYALSVVDCLKKTELWVKKNIHPTQPIAYFLESGSTLGRIVSKVWNSFSDKEREEKLMGSLTWRAKEKACQFESSDILAYESYKYWSRRNRRSFGRLVRPGIDFGHCFESRDIKHLIRTYGNEEEWKAYFAQFGAKF